MNEKSNRGYLKATKIEKIYLHVGIALTEIRKVATNMKQESILDNRYSLYGHTTPRSKIH